MWGFGNTFIMEAEQLLVNALELFEMGYFDCAYYSLRSCVEVSTIIVFLSDMPEDESYTYTEAWKDSEKFPMMGQMLRNLEEKGDVFRDVKDKMADFFSASKLLNEKLNKYVHKQGFRHFYVSRNHPFNNQSQDTFIKNFEYHITKCIGIVAVMRLVIDPFPVLLMDKEILYRSMDSMTEPYADTFVDEYIGNETLEAYKTTDIYQHAYEFYIGNERKYPATFDIVKWKYINADKMDEILTQLHLIGNYDIVAVLIVYACDKAVKVYCFNGMQMYHTNRKTNRTEMSWSGKDFRDFKNADSKINQTYGEAYISTFIFEDEPYFVEHNEILTHEDIANIFKIVLTHFSK